MKNNIDGILEIISVKRAHLLSREVMSITDMMVACEFCRTFAPGIK